MTAKGLPALVLLVAVACAPAGPRPLARPAPAVAVPQVIDALGPAAPLPAIAIPDPSIRGRSGELRTVVAMPGEVVPFPLRWLDQEPRRARYAWRVDERSVATSASSSGPRFASWQDEVAGDGPSGSDAPAGPPTGEDLQPLPADHRLVAPQDPGVYRLVLDAPGGAALHGDIRLLVLVPLTERRGTHLEGYFVGRYPTEASGRDDAYAPPRGLIRVTPELAQLRLSTHFRLHEFLTHDQRSSWPKFVLVDRALVDKLELVLDELESEGIQAERMIVMSGFRTPQYNGQGLGAGRASLSRHQWGDAADVWVDNDGDWYMDDLNRDGRRDTGDARVILRAVERIEARHPDLIGGAGIYPDNGVHGPFIHIDTRGSRARW